METILFFALFSAAENDKPSTNDKKFIEEALQGGTAEVQLAEIAKMNSESDEVKKLAKHIQESHSKANEELKTLASEKNVTVQTEMTAKHKMLAERLRNLSGAEFDRAYAKAMIDDHKKDIAMFEKAKKSAKDPELKAFAEKTLPTLREQLEMSESTHKRVEGKTEKKKGY